MKKKRVNQEPLSGRFNSFHLAVAIYQARAAWILENLDIDHEGIYLLRDLNDGLNALIELQDCN